MLNINDLQQQERRWHIIRFLAGLIGVFTANLAADKDGCRNGWRHLAESHLYPFEV